MIYFYKNQVPPPAPASASLSPANAAVGAVVTANWSAVGGATDYNVSLICTTNSGYNQSRNGTTGTSATFTLNNPGTYKVSVTAKNSAGASPARESGAIAVHPNSTVTFKDYDGAILKKQSVPYGAGASAPVAPNREGYDFQGWDRGFENITGDTIVTATYKIIKYTVRFLDDKGNILSSQTINYGDAATPPIPVPPDGEVFVDWDSHEYELVKKDLEITASYAWGNPDLPHVVGIDSAARNAERTGYNVVVRLVNYDPQGATRGRVIVALKTEAGKMVASETKTYDLAVLASAPEAIFVPYSGVATTADVSVVGLLDDANTGVPLAGMQTATIDLGLAWSDWSVDPPPEEAGYITESRSEYRYKDKSTTTSSSSTLSGWTRYDAQVTAWGNWSDWQNSSVSTSASREVQTRTVDAQYKTVWKYYRYEYWNTSYNAWYSTYSSSMGGTYQEIVLDSPLSQTGTHSGHASYGAYNYNGRNNTLWWFDSSYSVQTAAAYTQWRYRDAIYTYYFEKWSDWSDWLAGAAPAATESKQVEARTTHRFKSNDIKLTAYNYKRYKYQNLADGKEYYTYNTAYADSMGYPGEWEQKKSYSELPVVETVAGNIALHNGYGEDSWYKADVNAGGNVNAYITHDTLEDTGGTERTISGSVNAPGKLATLLVFRKTNEDPTASQLEYVDQTTLSPNGEYGFTFKTKDEPTGKTGDFLVMLAVEGGKNPVYIGRIEAPLPVYSVVFTDEAGIEIERQSVIEGQSAVLPAAPEKEGHDFAGWDENTTNIRKDLSVAAAYTKKKHNVVFVDWDNSDIAIGEFEYGDILTVDNVPEKEGSSFSGWITPEGEDAIEVTRNMIVTAKYDLNSYTVRFLDWDGAPISEQTVKYGEAAEAPQIGNPPQSDMLFKSWNGFGAHEFVIEDLTVSPIPMFAETVASPVISLASGDYSGSQTVTLSCNTLGAKILFTVDGTVPEYINTEYGPVINGNQYYSPITVSEDTTLLAMAFADGKNDSELAMGLYNIDAGALPVVAPVTADPPSGEVTSGTAISLSAATAGATIRYTTDGSEPTETSAVYTGPIELFADATIKAKAFKADMEASETSAFVYTVTNPAEPPVDPDVPAVIVGNVSGNPGDEVIVPIALANNPGIAGFTYALN
ncbi:MAG: chitobiase/beta-hexosaminidase C-terminal domain-containing protein, partial [Clostridiales Family XIII bacterium]|nr:chitobiase/beta-hexosaminidase C-terminal domain-containing protein [Clostridiales Family XIII bacterium]